MTEWLAVVEYDTPDPVHAPTALSIAVRCLDYRLLAGRPRLLELSFPVEAATLRAATETALRLARAAMRSADMAGDARSVRVELADPDGLRLAS
jgi:hypothetical protein